MRARTARSSPGGGSGPSSVGGRMLSRMIRTSLKKLRSSSRWEMGGALRAVCRRRRWLSCWRVECLLS
jgi:hypothetical protein